MGFRTGTYLPSPHIRLFERIDRAIPKQIGHFGKGKFPASTFNVLTPSQPRKSVLVGPTMGKRLNMPMAAHLGCHMQFVLG
jgi:hypothetical protein